jgi:hypothetical protein
MTGYATIRKLRRIEEECAAIGMKLACPKYGWGNQEPGTRLAVIPMDDALPIFCRDAELFTGTLEELNEWLLGVQWMHNYYLMLRLVDEKKIKKKEDEIRHAALIRKLKEQPKEEKVAVL